MNRCLGGLGILKDTDGVDKAFMVGGSPRQQNENSHATMEVMDLATGQWTLLGASLDLEFGLSAMANVVINNRFVLLDGRRAPTQDRDDWMFHWSPGEAGWTKVDNAIQGE